jgi:hypothetical protein
VQAHGDELSPIWSFDGGFSRADSFRTARSGQAYYFLNDTGLDSLRVPYLAGITAKDGASKAGQGREEIQMLRLAAQAQDSSRAGPSVVQVGVDKKARAGEDAYDQFAPPARFEPVSLRIEASDSTGQDRKSLLMAEARPPAEASGEGEGHVFDLRISSQLQSEVRLSASNLSAIGRKSVALLDPKAKRSYNLREKDSVMVSVNEGRELRLAVGTKRFVENKRKEVLPEKISFGSYPNPVREDCTFEFALPETKKVTIQIYNVLGRRVATLVDRRKRAAGRHEVEWDVSRLASGMYFGRLKVGERTQTQKIVVIR